MAHMLWVNLNECYTHPPGHVLLSLGWGHSVPLDDLLASSSGTVHFASYALIDPDGNKTDLGLPSKIEGEPIEAKGDLKIEPGNLGIRKLSLTKETKPGTWQAVATSKENFFTKYIDKKGRQRMAQKSMDQITNANQILVSMKHLAFAKSFTAVQEWTPPKPLGYELELMPMTDLSNVHVGDLVSFRVTFMGKPVVTSPKNLRYLTATSNSFGGPDGFFIGAYIMNGKAQFRIPAAGQWVANVYVKQDVTPESYLKNLVGKCTTVYYAGTISFNVKP